MSVPAATAAASLASQIQDLTSQATGEMNERTKKREEAAIAAAKAPPTRARFSLMGLYLALPVLATLIAVAFFSDSLMEMVTPAPSPEIAHAQAQADLDFAVREIEAFRADFSALPETLVQVGAPRRGDWTYTRGGDGRYQLVRRLHGQVVTFNGAQKKVASNEK